MYLRQELGRTGSRSWSTPYLIVDTQPRIILSCNRVYLLETTLRRMNSKFLLQLLWSVFCFKIILSESLFSIVLSWDKWTTLCSYILFCPCKHRKDFFLSIRCEAILVVSSITSLVVDLDCFPAINFMTQEIALKTQNWSLPRYCLVVCQSLDINCMERKHYAYNLGNWCFCMCIIY